jgi:isorenieratene synthase
MVSGDFVIDNYFWLDRIYPEFRVWAAIGGGSALEVQIYGPPEVLAAPEATLLTQATADAERAFHELRGSLVHGVAWRNPPVHTLFAVGLPAEHLGTITPWPGIVACGDWVRHPSPAFYLERATVTAISAANAVLAAHGQDPWSILPAAEPEPLARAIGAGVRGLRRAVRGARGRARPAPGA